MQVASDAQLRVLLADPSGDDRAEAQHILGSDFDLVLADGGEQAWATVTADPDVLAVFADAEMSGMDGFELLQRIRADERAAIHELPVIMITPAGDAEARHEALKRGATDFISKPFDRAELLARARAYATQDRIRRHAQALSQSQLQDSVTGLGTRAYFEKRLEPALAQCRRRERAITTLQIELIGLGEGAGGASAQVTARVLREAGQALAHRLRTSDVLVRLDEARFGAICPNCDGEGAAGLTRRLLDTLRATGFAGRTVSLGAAAGAHVGPGPPGTGVGTVYRAAETALEQAIARGDGAVVMDDEHAAHAGHRDRAGAEATPTADPPQTLAEALEILETPDGPERLRPHLPELLDACARLLEAAPADVAAPYLERLSDVLDRAPT